MIKKHPNHIVLGIGMMMIGSWLMANDRFFQWPPYAVDFVNYVKPLFPRTLAV